MYSLPDNDVTGCFIVVFGDTSSKVADNNSIKLCEFLGFPNGIVEVFVHSVQDMDISTLEYEILETSGAS